MTEKITFEQLLISFAEIPTVTKTLVMKALEKSARQVRNTAKRKFGEYQPSYGPFEAWAVLSRNYVIEKIAYGAPGDEPLIGYYREGRNKVWDKPLKDTLEIEMDAANWAAIIGTRDPLAPWHEYGTIHIPPRPFLRPALYQNEEWLKKTMQEAISVGMVTVFK